MNDRDNVAADLLQILRDCGIEATTQDLLMQKLCSYVSRRDSKVWNHAYNLGKKQNEEAQDNQKEK